MADLLSGWVGGGGGGCGGYGCGGYGPVLVPPALICCRLHEYVQFNKSRQRISNVMNE